MLACTDWTAFSGAAFILAFFVGIAAIVWATGH